MANRVDATITIGGPVPADRLEDLLQQIEAERLGPDWDERFSRPQDLLAYLEAGAEGAVFYAREVAGGEFDDLQAFCAEVGLTYVLTYDGYGCEWGPPAASAARATPATGSPVRSTRTADTPASAPTTSATSGWPTLRRSWRSLGCSTIRTFRRSP